MKRLMVLTAAAAAAATLAASPVVAPARAGSTGATTQERIHVQLRRYYHADGYLEAIRAVAYRTTESPDPRIRGKWRRAARWLRSVRSDASRKLYALRHPYRAPTPTGYDGHGYYAGLQRIPFANPYCESGGDPHNARNPKYRGKWQFDQATWNAYTMPAYRGRDPAFAPEWVQDWTAVRVPYDAWPNC